MASDKGRCTRDLRHYIALQRWVLRTDRRRRVRRVTKSDGAGGWYSDGVVCLNTSEVASFGPDEE